ncbi:hypothetical protein BDQ17DRAFT_1334791 [Cyathus striatus]|nr:hypothetical protein BDQ17DRAFT_1334791 [Cyathus striatus]
MAIIQSCMVIWYNQIKYLNFQDLNLKKNFFMLVMYHTTQRDNREVLSLAWRELLIVLHKLKVRSRELKSVEVNLGFSLYAAPLVILGGLYFKFKIGARSSAKHRKVGTEEGWNRDPELRTKP